MARYHEESLMNLSLVRRMVSSPEVAKVRRAIDSRWAYEKIIPISMSGFNPYSSAIYHGQESMFARWLPNATRSARDFNEADVLVREVLLAVHDYLHVWGYALVNETLGSPALGYAEITRSTLEPLAFLHLVTEAIATVGLDYWYLSTFDLGTRIPIGTGVRTLTVSYHEDFIEEYRKFDRSLVVQTPSFFATVVRMYCSGEYGGFDGEALRRSPRVFSWMRKELQYGALQRRYIRQWLRRLSPAPSWPRHDDLDAPMSCEQSWQHALVDVVAHELWDFVRSTGAHRWPSPPRGAGAPARRWSSLGREIDYRFVNANAAAPRMRGPESSGASGRYLAYQLISRHRFESVPTEVVQKLTEPGSLTPRRVTSLLRDAFPLRCDQEREPYDLLLLA
jgi:hypothetical protein